MVVESSLVRLFPYETKVPVQVLGLQDIFIWKSGNLIHIGELVRTEIPRVDEAIHYT